MAAYDARPDTKRGTCVANASRILKHPLIQEYINKSTARASNRIAVTIETLVDEQAEAMQMAKAGNNAVAYAAASMNKAKLLGMLVDRAIVAQATVDMRELAPDLASIWSKAKLKLLPQSLPEPEPIIEIASDYRDIEE